MERKKSAYVIAAQGHRRRFLSDVHFQPWVENINKLLRMLGFRTTVLSSGDHTGVYYSNDGELRILIHKKMSFLNDYFSIFLGFKMLISRRPALVVSHGLQHYLTLTSLVFFGFLKRAPTLVVVHGMYETNHPIGLLRDKSIRSLLRLLNKLHTPCLLISLTHYDKRNLVKKWGLADSNVIVSPFPLYINLDEVRALSKIKNPSNGELENHCTFLYLGRLSEEKGIDKIIRALNTVLTEGYKARLIIVGDGPLREEIVSLVKRLGLTDAVKIQGVVSGDKKWNFYAKSDALVLASKHEGFPRVIVEAFAAGKSVIVPRICGLPEVVTHAVNGFLFENEKELVECMMENVQKMNLVRSIGRSNKKIVMEQMILEKSGPRDFSRIISQLGVCP